MQEILVLYHGSDHKLPKPEYGFGKQDNDYGSGFYTTMDIQKAKEWAAVNGTDAAYVNKYTINAEGLKVVDLDEYGTLSWIAEIVSNRGARGEAAMILGSKLVKKYKVDLSDADIVIGYRADDSYSDIIDAFLQNQLNIDEVDRLFRKGDLGKQCFIKSETAFNRLQFEGAEPVNLPGFTNESEVRARTEVSQFLRKRSNQILLNNFHPYGITAIEAATNQYQYDKEYQYYTNMENELELEEEEYEHE